MCHVSIEAIGTCVAHSKEETKAQQQCDTMVMLCYFIVSYHVMLLKVMWLSLMSRYDICYIMDCYVMQFDVIFYDM